MDLGIDLETEILAWLPLKSAMRFRCVQRSWNDLIQTPTFLKKRHMNMSDSPSLTILYNVKPYVTLLSCDTVIHIKSLFSNKTICNKYRIESYGSCNGVFCLKGFCWFHKSCLDELIMWNPTTREVHHIPQTPCFMNESHLYGFGAADPHSNNFKVVKLHSSYGTRLGIPNTSSAEVYNLSTKSWTTTKHPPPFTIISRQHPLRYNTLVNGVCHWITSNSYFYHNDDVANILCFDFRNNQFHQLRGPTFSYEDRNYLLDDVAEINGSLAYILQGNFNAPVVLNIWIMDQSGWKKKYNIGPIMTMFRMFGFWKKGDRLFGGKVGEPLTSYDREGNSLCKFQFVVDYTEHFWIHEYVPSIAPLSN